MEMLAQFNQLIQELIGGSLRRHTFHAWEMELLVDFAHCPVRRPARGNMLRRYQKAALKQFARGDEAPLRLADFLAHERARRPRDRQTASAALSSN
jgi:hypothetical protein